MTEPEIGDTVILEYPKDHELYWMNGYYEVSSIQESLGVLGITRITSVLGLPEKFVSINCEFLKVL